MGSGRRRAGLAPAAPCLPAPAAAPAALTGQCWLCCCFSRARGCGCQLQLQLHLSAALLLLAEPHRLPPGCCAGLVQSSFFYGYLLSQIPGGYAASLLGGRKVLPGGVALWSGAWGWGQLPAWLPGCLRFALACAHTHAPLGDDA